MGLWRAIGDDLLAGREPKTLHKDSDAGMSIGELCTLYIQHKGARCKAGRLTERTLADYDDSNRRMIVEFGKNRLVEDLKASDFTNFAASLDSQFGKSRRGNIVNMIRMVFNWGYDNEHLERPPRFGSSFRRESAPRKRRLFTAAQVLQIHHYSSDSMRAMILLGVNAALGNTDCATLNKQHIDFAAGVLNFPRAKTGIERPNTPLWPETIESLRLAIERRPDPADNLLSDRVFLTRLGQEWVRHPRADAVAQEFRKTTKAIGIDGLGFYTLRRTFRTVADATGDQRACDAIMGHVTPGMGTRYVQEVDTARLAKVTNHVRAWLYSHKSG